MELIRTWIFTVTASALVLAAAEALMPEGAVKKVGKLTGGLVLVLGILQPLAGMDYEDLYQMVDSLPAGALSQEALTEEAVTPMKTIIEEELAAYIEGKGQELGLDCTAAVTCAVEDGVPVPQRVTVTGSFTEDRKASLQTYISDDLGIPRERQLYQREGGP